MPLVSNAHYQYTRSLGWMRSLVGGPRTTHPPPRLPVAVVDGRTLPAWRSAPDGIAIGRRVRLLAQPGRVVLRLAVFGSVGLGLLCAALFLQLPLLGASVGVARPVVEDILRGRVRLVRDSSLDPAAATTVLALLQALLVPQWGTHDPYHSPRNHPRRSDPGPM